MWTPLSDTLVHHLTWQDGQAADLMDVVEGEQEFAEVREAGEAG